VSATLHVGHFRIDVLPRCSFTYLPTTQSPDNRQLYWRCVWRHAPYTCSWAFGEGMVRPNGHSHLSAAGSIRTLTVTDSVAGSQVDQTVQVAPVAASRKLTFTKSTNIGQSVYFAGKPPRIVRTLTVGISETETGHGPESSIRSATLGLYGFRLSDRLCPDRIGTSNSYDLLPGALGATFTISLHFPSLAS